METAVAEFLTPCFLLCPTHPSFSPLILTETSPDDHSHGNPNPPHDRQRPHRPGVALALARRLSRGQGFVPLGARPDGRIQGTFCSSRVPPSFTNGSREATRRCSRKSRLESPRAAGRLWAAGGFSPTATSPAASRSCGRRSTVSTTLRKSSGEPPQSATTSTPFGHHAMMPQLLKKSGLDSYVFMRPGPHEKELPGRLFWWENG